MSLLKNFLVLFSCVLMISVVNAATTSKHDSILDLESDGSKHVVTIEYEDCSINIMAGDGFTTSITIEDGPKVEFIASRNKTTGQVDIFPISRGKKLHNGKEVDYVNLGNRLESGQITDQMRATGIKKMSVVHSGNQPLANLSNNNQLITAGNQRDIQTFLKKFGMSKAVLCPEEPCQAMYCCTFVACNGKRGRVCSTGPVCGGDGCGECCAG
ncbi:MAG: hypothetical protein JNM52_05940 [Betaproteobacteria bacterium]|nr:hypothetical protein [Betaproteobacteria bacterium]